MKTFDIIHQSEFYIPENNWIATGGVTTYVYDLAKLAISLGYKTTVHQITDRVKSGVYNFDGILIDSLPSKGKSCQNAFESIYQGEDKERLYIVSTDQTPIKARHKNVIAINHGIAFDQPIYSPFGPLIKLIKCIRNVIRAKMFQNIVCVDYNYINWLRTLYSIPRSDNFIVIPNYAQGNISEHELEKKLANSTRKKIVFARRFVDYRGTLIFAKAVERLLFEFPDIDVTFAGDGPLKERLISMFNSEQRVHITKYKSKDSLSFHYQFDIAVVPTIFSEGTSLSLCEAMAAGCFCIATHVGGITNIILDHFNGFLVKPDDVEALYDAIREAITCDKNDFNQIVKRAYETASTAFSKKAWELRWREYIEKSFKD